MAACPREAREEVMTRQHEHVAALQPAIEFCTRDRQAREPEPEEERAFGTVDPQRQAVARLAQRRHGERAPFLRNAAGSRRGTAPAARRCAAAARRSRPRSTPGASAAVALNAVSASMIGSSATTMPVRMRRQAELGQAEAEHDVGVPERSGMRVLDAGERQAVRRVDDERHVVRTRQRVEAFELGQRQHVARRIGRPRHADRAHVGGHGQARRSRRRYLKKPSRSVLDRGRVARRACLARPRSA